jgi:hypothetical protein
MTSEQSQTQFVFTILKYTTLKLNTRHLSAALNLTPAATTMRMTRLKRKLAQTDAKVMSKDWEFFVKVWEFSGGKVDLKAVAGELGLNVAAVSMRITRLRKKLRMVEEGKVES